MRKLIFVLVLIVFGVSLMVVFVFFVDKGLVGIFMLMKLFMCWIFDGESMVKSFKDFGYLVDF